MFDELREMNLEITKKQERIDELRAVLTSTSIFYGDRVMTSPEDKMSKLMCEIIVLENELEGMIDEYADMKATVKGEIFSLENEDWVDILYSRYVEFESWERIAKRHNSTVKAVMQKKKRAAKKLKTTRYSENCG